MARGRRGAGHGRHQAGLCGTACFLARQVLGQGHFLQALDATEQVQLPARHLQSAGERAFDGLVLAHGLAAAGQAQIDGGPAGRIANLVLGAHLGHGGKVEGGCVRCPFHAWRFDEEGRCNDHGRSPIGVIFPLAAKTWGWDQLNDEKLNQVIKDELAEIRAKHGSDRKSQITFDAGDMDLEDLIDDEDLIVTMSAKGYIKTVSY